MANEPLALARQPAATSEDDYRSFCAALETSARGRAFLAEYARRNRHADTQVLLAALDRLETMVRGHTAAPEADRIRQELRALLDAIRAAKPQITGSPAADRTRKLAMLIALIERRIAALVAPAREPSALPPEVAALVMPERPTAEAVRSHLAVVPPAEEPELPIPSRAGTPPPIALVPEKKLDTGPAPAWQPLFGSDQAPTETARAAAMIPEVTFAESAPPNPAASESAVVETIVVETVAVEIAAVMTLEPPVLAAVESAGAAPAAQAAAPAPAAIEIKVAKPQAVPTAPATDPLALIMALSEDERIALFT